ncbi:malto-oligosyltrehalose synthase [Sphingobacterium oryzagri]|uniref:4-alpha-glucanotransferase n=1 Tax=Sphingobacterium oryzagri TaxID=3025669 RepID=A0ABY7WLW8_9SPHI|nr:malto-oligosyltrehalose synthase [Sphingobacterium sp. KACC 22765]WDF70490.1 malto-oligosyltrehalose synthase [Sphingobacterium sp. KACC 22765]
MQTIHTPTTTYRLQFNKDFTFTDLDKIIPYLQTLGIDTIYASPILASTAGSNHGYDGINMQQIDPEIGDYEQLVALKKKLSALGFRWVQDIVPNHMAFTSANPWLMDLLEHGKSSAYRDYFDTSLADTAWFADDRLMVPTLGKSVEEALTDQEITIERRNDKLYFIYFDQYWPLSPASAKKITGKMLSDSSDVSAVDKLQEKLSQINKQPKKLRELLDVQHYRLCAWHETDEQINFRRFFTVNGLICLRINEKQVFEDAHSLLASLLREGIIDGLRVDHVDGIFDPTKYLSDLRALSGAQTYILAEKILEAGEKLPDNWPIQGTTGYEFLAASNDLQVPADAEKKLTKTYENFVGKQPSLKKQQRAKKAAILDNHMAGEVHNLLQLLLRLKLLDNVDEQQHEKLEKAIALFLVYFPVYRLYENTFPFSEGGYNTTMSVFDKAKKQQPKLQQELTLLSSIFSRAQQQEDAEYGARAAKFFMRCMQFTGPVMAKGVEDTLMYTYNRYIGLNEVGDHPANFGLDRKKFHKEMAERQQNWPAALNTSATHDTKRGEDARTRLQLIASNPDLWAKTLKKWLKIVEKNYGADLPHANDVYFIFQALYASHPMPSADHDNFSERFADYLVKYLREGKERSDWASPNEDYETSIQQFAHFLLDTKGSFYPSFTKFLSQTADFGVIHSLGQLLLKFTAPGVPDVYQGTELWDFSFVDPDNRRAVDYTLREKYLEEIAAIPTSERLSSLWSQRYDGKIKLALLQQLTQLRNTTKSLSPQGSYTPLKVEGKYSNHLLAFARQFRQSVTIIIVPVQIGAIEKFRQLPVEQWDWEDTHVLLPHDGQISYQNALNGQTGEGTKVLANSIFAGLPLAILQYELPDNPRKSGILMHISSLPSKYGIGDLGKPAHDFAKTLQAAGQQYWQVLPLGPLSEEQFFSPYSTLSALAGNPLLISLEELEKEGFLTSHELAEAQMPSASQVDYAAVASQKNALLQRAFDRSGAQDDVAFQKFCTDEASWLEDYCLFMALRAHHDDAPWYTWDKVYKQRDSGRLTHFKKQSQAVIDREKWLQYVFDKQWQLLKDYCFQSNISLLGDIPIYVGHDSADVWANPALFSLNEEGHIEQMAGVPPDYFNADGQQWGMPVFDWDAHKKDNYQWWIQRVKRNLLLFDRVRLDHFRAFSAYWSIPAAAETAAAGNWQTGPGNDLFAVLQSEFETMPFIAEDLGDIDDKVYNLRDNYKLPGMKVLQFAFGADMPKSPHIPHNYDKNFVVYTGTHDNNTTVGWFKQELDEASRKRLQAYVSSTVYARNIADMLIKLAYASIAETVIIPMQDILSLGRKHRMNTPASTVDNWSWRMLPQVFRSQTVERLKQYNKTYNRN